MIRKRRGVPVDFKRVGECFVVVSHTPDESGYIRICKGRRRVPLHRYIYEEMFGFVADSQVIRHKCDNPLCINPEHLLEGTVADNVNDKCERGRQARGLSHGMHKLKESDVRKIRRSKKTGVATGKEFGITQAMVSMIRLRKSWSHVA